MPFRFQKKDPFIIFKGVEEYKGGPEMYEGNAVALQMIKTISADGVFDDATHRCQVFRYDMEEDYIYLKLRENDLKAISLDAKYQCYISTRTELLSCSGVVKERYQSENGNILVFRIENGFYVLDRKNK